MRTKVAIIGVYPPPIGGISVHIKRLCNYLDQLGIPYTLYDNTPGEKDRPRVFTGPIERWSLTYFFRAKEAVIHCHFLRWQVRFFLSLLKLRGKRIIFTFHSYRPEEERLSFLKRCMIRVIGRLGDRFICVSGKIADSIAAAGIPRDKIVVIPAFIPPNDPPEAVPLLPGYLESFVAGGSPLLAANGIIGNFYKGEDLYGTDLCLELARALKSDFPRLRFVFCITSTVDPAYRARLEERIGEYGLRDHFLFVEEQMEFYPLLQKADLMVRPTRSDGDALSVREALMLGTPVLASDAAERPEQAVVFQSGNLEDLIRKARELLRSGKRIEPSPPPGFEEQVVRTYGFWKGGTDKDSSKEKILEINSVQSEILRQEGNGGSA